MAVLAALVVGLFFWTFLDWAYKGAADKKANFSTVMTMEPRQIAGDLYYFDTELIQDYNAPEAFQNAVGLFLRKHPELQVRSIAVEKKHQAGISGYYVILERIK